MKKFMGFYQDHEKTEYKYVQKVKREGKTIYTSNLKGTKRINSESARECAIYVDKQLIKMGKTPVNVLKPKLDL